MKKSPSQLVMEALFREDAAERKPSGGAGDGMMAFSRSTGVFSAGDLSGFGFGFGSGDSNTLNGSITDHPWSQNLNVRHPAISTTIDSQSSFYVASPTSATNPNGKDNLAPGGTSGSDSDSESLLDTEGDPCEQSRDPTDMKRMRRMVSNRESARRSRKRKQAHLADLETQVDQLRGVNASLFEQFTDANQQFKTAVTDNRILKSDVEALRVKVKMAEDMVTRGALSCGLGHLGLAPILNPRQTCQATDTITGLDFTGDDACFAELSPAEHLQNSPIQSIASLESLENPMPGDAASCGVWHWDSHSNGMSK